MAVPTLYPDALGDTNKHASNRLNARPVTHHTAQSRHARVGKDDLRQAALLNDRLTGLLPEELSHANELLAR